jgi:hypothetical protein
MDVIWVLIYIHQGRSIERSYIEKMIQIFDMAFGNPMKVPMEKRTKLE